MAGHLLGGSALLDQFRHLQFAGGESVQSGGERQAEGRGDFFKIGHRHPQVELQLLILASLLYFFQIGYNQALEIVVDSAFMLGPGFGALMQEKAEGVVDLGEFPGLAFEMELQHPGLP